MPGSGAVLILNQNYEPLNVCGVRRALVLVLGRKAQPLELGEGEYHSISETFAIPSVIRLLYLVKRPLFTRRLSRREVFWRDRFTCQYCGKQTKELTLDPRHPPRPERPAHVGERRRRLRALQSPEGRAHPVAGEHAPPERPCSPQGQPLLPPHAPEACPTSGAFTSPGCSSAARRNSYWRRFPAARASPAWCVSSSGRKQPRRGWSGRGEGGGVVHSPMAARAHRRGRALFGE